MDVDRTGCTTWPTVIRTPARRRRCDHATDSDVRGRVITLPVERTLTAARQHGGRRRGPAGRRRRRLAGRRLGRDPTLVGPPSSSARCAGTRSSAAVDRLPARPAALIVVNDRRWSLARSHGARPHARDRPARALRRPARRRADRGAGPPPRRPVGPARRGRRRARGPASCSSWRRVDVAPATRRARRPPPDRRRRRDPKSAVFPAATASSPWGRSARIEVGPCVRPGAAGAAR